MEELKSIMPILTFFLGVFFTPYIESIKEKSKTLKLIKGIKLELLDEYSILIDSIKTTQESIAARTYKPKDFQHLQLGRKFNALLLTDNLSKVYSSLNGEYRLAFKSIVLMQNQINEKHNDVLSYWRSNNFKCRAVEESMQYSMLSLYYVLSKINTEKENFRFPRLQNEDIVALAAESLKIPQPMKRA